jgi:hypothetical protein
VTLWRRAKEQYRYGQLYRDDDGRLAVKLEVVEQVEGTVFSDEKIAALFCSRKKGRPRDPLLPLNPGAIRLPSIFTNNPLRAQAMQAYGKHCVELRDEDWARYLVANFKQIRRREGDWP